MITQPNENGMIMTNNHPEQLNTDEWEKEFIEIGADMEHERWSKWQKYLHSLFPKNEDGSITISPERVVHWERQINTPYTELSEKEKEYDREEVRKYLPLISRAIISERERIVGIIENNIETTSLVDIINQITNSK